MAMAPKKLKEWPDVLKAFRDALSMTQTQLADWLEISKRIVVYWEDGREIPFITQIGLTCLIRYHAPLVFARLSRDIRDKVEKVQ